MSCLRGFVHRTTSPAIRIQFPGHRKMTSASSLTPIEDSIRSKLTTSLSPSLLEIYNDSHLHAHHKAMAGSTSKETHFRLVVVSDAFSNRRQLERHRMVNGILKEELERVGGVHALQMRTLTKEEEARLKEKADELAEEKKDMA